MSVGALTSPQPPSVVAEFFHWWTAELRDWLIWRKAPTATALETLPADLTIERSGIVAGEAKTWFAMSNADAAVRLVKQSRRGGRRKLHVLLAADRFVVRRLANGMIPLERAFRMAQLDVTANTPFSVDDVYILFADETHSSEKTEFVLLKRSAVDPLIEAIKSNGCQLGSLWLSRGGRKQQVAAYATTYFNDGVGSSLAWVGKRWFVACLAISAALIFWNIFAALDLATADVDKQTAIAEPGAQKARAAFRKNVEYISALTTLYRERKDYLAATKVLEELARIIPDDTFLTDFSLKENRILLSGFSSSAASLIAILDANSFFKNPRFVTAVVKVPDQKGEQFSIELELRHAG